VKSLYYFDEKSDLYSTEDPNAVPASQVSGSGESCTCTNVLKEIKYTVITATKNGPDYGLPDNF